MFFVVINFRSKTLLTMIYTTISFHLNSSSACLLLPSCRFDMIEHLAVKVWQLLLHCIALHSSCSLVATKNGYGFVSKWRAPGCNKNRLAQIRAGHKRENLPLIAHLLWKCVFTFNKYTVMLSRFLTAHIIFHHILKLKCTRLKNYLCCT